MRRMALRSAGSTVWIHGPDRRLAHLIFVRATHSVPGATLASWARPMRSLRCCRLSGCRGSVTRAARQRERERERAHVSQSDEKQESTSGRLTTRCQFFPHDTVIADSARGRRRGSTPNRSRHTTHHIVLPGRKPAVMMSIFGSLSGFALQVCVCVYARRSVA